jgi:hypothetical protein
MLMNATKSPLETALELCCEHAALVAATGAEVEVIEGSWDGTDESWENV